VSLSALDLKKLAGLVGSAPGSVFVKLTPKDPSVAYRGALVFVSPTLVEGGENYAVWGKPTSGGKPNLSSLAEAAAKDNILNAQKEQGGKKSSGQNSAPVLGSEGSLVLWLKPEAGKKYLIDIAVQSSSSGARFRVLGPSGTAPMELDALPQGQHITFVLVATNDQWQAFQLIGTGTNFVQNLYTRMEWAFYSCEVTNL
jgi:hypothetical protein